MVAYLNEVYKSKNNVNLNRVCIFDIDNTLSHGADADNKDCCYHNEKCLKYNPKPAWPDNSGTSTYVENTINNCIDNGYHVAIATAEAGSESINKKQKNFINNLFGSGIYNTPLYQNACTAQGERSKCDLQTEYKNKTPMYINIMNYLGIPPSEYSNSIVFDDDKNNLKIATNLGFKTCQASNNCGGEYCTKGCGLGKQCSILPLY